MHTDPPQWRIGLIGLTGLTDLIGLIGKDAGVHTVALLG